MKSSGRSTHALILPAGTLSKWFGFVVPNATPRPGSPERSANRTSVGLEARRSRFAAQSVPLAPAPIMAMVNVDEAVTA